MNDFILNNISDFLYEKGICNFKLSRPFFGDGCIIVPVDIDSIEYFIKIFSCANKEKIQSEIVFVQYLHSRGIPVQEFLEIDRMTVFKINHEWFEYYLYITKAIENDNDGKISRRLLNNVIRQIAKLHINTFDFQHNLSGIEEIDDYKKLVWLYISGFNELLKLNIEKDIERIIISGNEKTTHYPIHSDLRISNILTSNGQFKAFIDFSDIRYSGIEDDLGKFMQSIIDADLISVASVEYYLQVYEISTGNKVSRRNVYISIVYHELKCYFDDLERSNDIKLRSSLLRKIEDCIKYIY